MIDYLYYISRLGGPHVPRSPDLQALVLPPLPHQDRVRQDTLQVARTD